jgi:hypothetical protein
MNCEMWEAVDGIDFGERIGIITKTIAIKVGATTPKELRARVGGELVGALVAPKDFQIVKAWIYLFLHQ